MKKSEIQKMMSYLGKMSHKKSPRPIEYYRKIGKKGKESQARKRLSTDSL